MAVRTALGGRVKRREDPRLVTGNGKYTDDVQPEHCLHAVFVRSTMAHARLAAVDVTAARDIPGVEAVCVAADLKFESETARPRLCTDEVNFVGDLIAIAVGSTREAAVAERRGRGRARAVREPAPRGRAHRGQRDSGGA